LSEDCQAFVAALNRVETQPSVTEEAEARAEQTAAELLAVLGLDNSPIRVPASSGQIKKSQETKRVKKEEREENMGSKES